jgi:imidazolonepropionase-like amidohydrolase
MKKLSCFVFLLLCSSGLVSQNPTTLIRNGSYLDLESGEFKKANILISDGRITAIGDAFIVPQDATVVEGTGKYIIPGMVDAHIHLFQSGGLYTRPDAIDLRTYRSYETEIEWLKANAGNMLKRYLRCGVTTVIDVGGPMHNYTIRDQYTGSTEYPNLFLTGPLISTFQPDAFAIDDPPIRQANSVEEAVQYVKDQLPYKPDFIKIWYIVRPGLSAEAAYEMVEAVIRESHANQLKVAVHATELATAKLALKAGADILVHSVDDPVDEAFKEQLLKSGAVYIPTLVVHGNYIKTFAQETDPTAADFAWSLPIPLGSLFDLKHLQKNEQVAQYFSMAPRLKTRLSGMDESRGANLKLLHDAGILVATGTDAGNIGTLHGSSYFDELAAMQEAGLSPLQIIKASTINGAKVLDKADQIGSIEVGKMADLVVLNRDPLADLNHLQDIHAVVKGGQWHAAEDILEYSPEDLVQQQLNGYNARDIDAFVAPYSEDVELYTFPNEPMGKGKANMRVQYQQLFENVPELHCELVNRIVLGNTVIDQERVTGFPSGTLEAVAIYKIENGKIAKVYFIMK